MRRIILLLILCILVSACKVRIVVPKGGNVSSDSGTYSCSSEKSCDISVVNLFFDETFKANSDSGYKFRKWKNRNRGLCGGKTESCRLYTSEFSGNSALMGFLASDVVFYLEPVFQRTAPFTPTTLPSTELPTVQGRELVLDIASTDLNSDGIDDLILARTGSGYRGDAYFQALINLGDGTFEDQTSFYFEYVNYQNNSWVEKIYLVDINNDGRIDIVSHHDQSHWDEVRPLLQMSNGKFRPLDLGVLTDIGSLVPLDADNDGDIDLMAHVVDNFDNPLQQQVSWKLLVNNLVGTGEFSFSLGRGTITTLKGNDQSAYIYSPAILDINSDGLDDIFYGGPKHKAGFVDEVAPYVALINEGNHSFSDQAGSVIVGTEGLTHAREMSAADFNGDSYDDIVVSSTGYDGGGFHGEKNQLLLANGSGQLVVDVSRQQAFNYRGFTHSSDFSDIDGDGDIDIVFSEITGADIHYNRNIQVLINDGSASFTRRSTYFAVEGFGMWISSTKLSDLNLDGLPDLVLGGDDLKSPAVVIWNNGDGGF